MADHHQKLILKNFFRHNSMYFFVKYLSLLLQPETFSGTKLAELVHERERYTIKGATSRVSAARKLIERGLTRAALAYIFEVANPNRVGKGVKRDAYKLLEELPADV